MHWICLEIHISRDSRSSELLGLPRDSCCMNLEDTLVLFLCERERERKKKMRERKEER
ncbi:hypothetical protein Scep_017476 [Stephania cephalantha]|uniref:Uncharacterized protein n=1 Tax=Stephania cephalantha TaxID=152367 RepID=A0AAP0IPK0_9MAGN